MSEDGQMDQSADLTSAAMVADQVFIMLGRFPPMMARQCAELLRREIQSEQLSASQATETPIGEYREILMSLPDGTPPGTQEPDRRAPRAVVQPEVDL